MTFGVLVAFIGYLVQILTAVMVATLMFVMLPRAEVCAARIGAVLDADISVVAPAVPVRLQGAEVRELALRNVEFRYPGAEDPATPPWHGAVIASAIPGARLRVIRGASHLANVSSAAEVSAALLAHLAG